MNLIFDEMRPIGGMSAEVIVVGIEPSSPEQALPLEQFEQAMAIMARTEAFFAQHYANKGGI